MTRKPKSLLTVDDEGVCHAASCASMVDRDPDAECDCRPCNGCLGHGVYTNERGKLIDCVECGNDQARTHRGRRTW